MCSVLAKALCSSFWLCFPLAVFSLKEDDDASSIHTHTFIAFSSSFCKMLLGDFSQFGKHPKLSYKNQGGLAKILLDW